MRGRSFRQGSLSRAGGLVGPALERMGIRKRVLEQQAVGNWYAVVGPQIAASSKAERLSEGTLFVSCKSSAWASELSLHKERIMKGLNESVGAEVVRDIRFSARGFRRSSESKEEVAVEPKGVEAIQLTPREADIARAISGTSRSPELAELIEKAILTGKRLDKARRGGKV